MRRVLLLGFICCAGLAWGQSGGSVNVTGGGDNHFSDIETGTLSVKDSKNNTFDHVQTNGYMLDRCSNSFGQFVPCTTKNFCTQITADGVCILRETNPKDKKPTVMSMDSGANWYIEMECDVVKGMTITMDSNPLHSVWVRPFSSQFPIECTTSLYQMAVPDVAERRRELKEEKEDETAAQTTFSNVMITGSGALGGFVIEAGDNTFFRIDCWDEHGKPMTPEACNEKWKKLIAEGTSYERRPQ